MQKMFSHIVFGKKEADMTSISLATDMLIYPDKIWIPVFWYSRNRLATGTTCIGFLQGHRSIWKTNCNTVMQKHMVKSLENSCDFLIWMNEAPLFNPVLLTSRWQFGDKESVCNQGPMSPSFFKPASSCSGSLEPIRELQGPWMGSSLLWLSKMLPGERRGTQTWTTMNTNAFEEMQLKWKPSR